MPLHRSSLAFYKSTGPFWMNKAALFMGQYLCVLFAQTHTHTFMSYQQFLCLSFFYFDQCRGKSVSWILFLFKESGVLSPNRSIPVVESSQGFVFFFLPSPSSHSFYPLHVPPRDFFAAMARSCGSLLWFFLFFCFFTCWQGELPKPVKWDTHTHTPLSSTSPAFWLEFQVWKFKWYTRWHTPVNICQSNWDFEIGELMRSSSWLFWMEPSVSQHCAEGSALDWAHLS